MGLEDQLARALDEVREARTRENGLMSVMREMIGHLGAVEQGESQDTADLSSTDSQDRSAPRAILNHLRASLTCINNSMRSTLGNRGQARQSSASCPCLFQLRPR